MKSPSCWPEVCFQGPLDSKGPTLDVRGCPDKRTPAGLTFSICVNVSLLAGILKEANFFNKGKKFVF